MKQIDIKELLPKMKPGYVACDEDGTWLWYSEKPILKYGYWDCSGKYCEEIPYIFDIAPAEDWTKSLIRIKGE